MGCIYYTREDVGEEGEMTTRTPEQRAAQALSLPAAAVVDVQEGGGI